MRIRSHLTVHFNVVVVEAVNGGERVVGDERVLVA